MKHMSVYVFVHYYPNMDAKWIKG